MSTNNKELCDYILNIVFKPKKKKKLHKHNFFFLKLEPMNK